MCRPLAYDVLAGAAGSAAMAGISDLESGFLFGASESERVSSPPVCVSTVTDPYHLNHPAGVDDLVQDPVVADAHPVNGILTGEGDAAGRPRVAGQQIQRRADPELLFARQPGDRLDRTAGHPHSVPVHFLRP